MVHPLPSPDISPPPTLLSPFHLHLHPSPQNPKSHPAPQRLPRRLRLPRTLLLAKRRERLKWAPLPAPKNLVHVHLPSANDSPIFAHQHEITAAMRRPKLFAAQRREGRSLQLLPLHSDMLVREQEVRSGCGVAVEAEEDGDGGLAMLGDLEIKRAAAATPNVSGSVRQRAETQASLLLRLSREEQVERLLSNDLDLAGSAWESSKRAGEGVERKEKRVEKRKKGNCAAQVKGEVGRVARVVAAEMEAMKHIVLREECMNVVRGLVEELTTTLHRLLLGKEQRGFRLDQKLRRVVAVRTMLDRSMGHLQIRSIRAIEAVESWRSVVRAEEEKRGKPKRHVFMYDGCNVLLKIIHEAEIGVQISNAIPVQKEAEDDLKAQLAQRYVARVVRKWIGRRAWPVGLLGDKEQRAVGNDHRDLKPARAGSKQQKLTRRKRKKRGTSRWDANYYAKAVQRGLSLKFSAVDIFLNAEEIHANANEDVVQPVSTSKATYNISSSPPHFPQYLSSASFVAKDTQLRKCRMMDEADRPNRRPLRMLRRCSSARRFTVEEGLLISRIEEAKQNMQRCADILHCMSCSQPANEKSEEEEGTTVSRQRIDASLKILKDEMEEVERNVDLPRALVPAIDKREKAISRDELQARHVGEDRMIRRVQARLLPLSYTQAPGRVCNFLIKAEKAEIGPAEDKKDEPEASSDELAAEEDEEEEDFDFTMVGPANAARLIQTYVRGYIQRQKFQLMQLDAFIATHPPSDLSPDPVPSLPADLPEGSNEKEALASALQRRSRQAVAFERVSLENDNSTAQTDIPMREEERAAVMIQAAMRGGIARSRLREHHERISEEIARLGSVCVASLSDIYASGVQI